MLALRSSNAVPSAIGVELEATFRQISSRGFIQFHPALAQRLGFKAALLFGHALYWSRHLAKTQPKRNGWFYMTAVQWQQATGLTSYEQARVRELLVEHGLLAEMMAGKPARLHFRVDLAQLTHWAGLHASEDGISSPITWERFSPWMRGCVVFYRPLVDVAGSVSAALYLSYLLQRQRGGIHHAQAPGFFCVSQQDVRIALCLGVKAQRNARDKLKRLGLIHEHQGLARVDLLGLAAALGHTSLEEHGQDESPRVRPLEVVPYPATPRETEATAPEGVRRWLEPSPVAQKAALGTDKGRLRQMRQLSLSSGWNKAPADAASLIQATTRLFAPAAHIARGPTRSEGSSAPTRPAQQTPALSSKVDTKAAHTAIPPCPFLKPTLPFFETHIQKENNRTTTTTHTRETSQGQGFEKRASRRRSIETTALPSIPNISLVTPASDTAQTPEQPVSLPSALAMQWHAAVRLTLAGAPPALRQRLVDELEGQLGISGKTIINPPGYLHALIRRHAEGNLVLALADQVAEARQERQRVASIVEKALHRCTTQPAQPPASEPKNDSLVARQARERLATLRREMTITRSGQ